MMAKWAEQRRSLEAAQRRKANFQGALDLIKRTSKESISVSLSIFSVAIKKQLRECREVCVFAAGDGEEMVIMEVATECEVKS